MKAMILAAGRGERMRPLTDTTPKPLLVVRGQPLIAWHVAALARGGFRRLVVNTAWLGDQIATYLSNYLSTYGNPANDSLLSISYSHEQRDFGYALETAGGIARALPQLADVFWVLASDVFVPDFEFLQADVDRFTASDKLAHLWLVPNPSHHPGGDFGLSKAGLALNLASDSANRCYTFSTIGLYRRAFFDTLPLGNPQGIKAPLGPLLRRAMDNQRVSAQLYLGSWTDVGTPCRLAALNLTAAATTLS